MRLYFGNKVSLCIVFSIWSIGVFISIPLLLMVDFLNDPQQCQLNMKPFHLMYIIALNVVLIFIPALILPILYIVMYIKIKSLGNNTIVVNDSKEEKTTSTKNVNNEYKKVSKVCFFKNLNSEVNSCSIAPMKNNKENGNSASFTSQQSKYHRKSTIFIIKSTKKKKNLKFIIIATIVFFCCQIPVRLFLCWSYMVHHFFPIILENNSETEVDESYIFLINLISQITSLIYFLHCISNSIIYNILSAKFRKAFLNGIKNLLLFKIK